jgi:hypothetical protein
MKPKLTFNELNVSRSTLSIFVIFDHSLVLMYGAEVSQFWWGFKVVHFWVWCISGSITLVGLPDAVGGSDEREAGPEPGAVIIDSSCPTPKKQRLFKRV